MNLCNICCCCQSKNENQTDFQLTDVGNNCDSLRKPVASVNVTPEPFVHAEYRDKPIFFIRPASTSTEQPITFQPKNKVNAITNKNDNQFSNIESAVNLHIESNKTYENGKNRVLSNDGFELNENASNQIKQGTFKGIENKSFDLDESQFEQFLRKQPTLAEREIFEKTFEELFTKTFDEEKITNKTNTNLNRLDNLPAQYILNDDEKPIGFISTTAIIDNIRISCLELHNRLRARHGCPPLKESYELNKHAQEWANYLIKNNKLEVCPNTNFGENIYRIDTPNAHVTMAVQYWYDEIKLYNFDNPNPTETHSEIGHFTQVIWRDSVELGTGVAIQGTQMVVVCNYSPPGNYRNQFNDYTVPRLIDGDRLTNDMIQNYIKKIRESSINIHNRYRALHGCPPLQGCDELDKAAEKTIDYIEANNGQLPDKAHFLNFGQNSLESTHPLAHITQAVQAWYELGKKEYDYDGTEKENIIERCFTTLIWRDALLIGTAVRRIGDSIRFVCVYSPSMSSNHPFKDYLIPRPITDKLYTPVDDYIDEIRWSCLEAHNRLRRLHGCPPLIGNARLDGVAEEWAKHLATTTKFYHRPNNKYGENLYCTSDNLGHVTMAVQNWYDEIQFYDYNKPDYSKETEHFTELIWKDCFELGTGIARGRNRYYVVCVYDPPGNVVGRFNDYYIPRRTMPLAGL